MVVLDKEKCIGCGTCVAIAPNCFELGKGGKAHVKKSCKCDDDCKLAIQTCPIGAISSVSSNK